MINKIKKAVIQLKAPRSPIKREIFYLKRAIKETDDYVNIILSKPQPPCCHLCAYPELHTLTEKQQRRKDRLKQLESKIEQGR